MCPFVGKTTTQITNSNAVLCYQLTESHHQPKLLVAFGARVYESQSHKSEFAHFSLSLSFWNGINSELVKWKYRVHLPFISAKLPVCVFERVSEYTHVCLCTPPIFLLFSQLFISLFCFSPFCLLFLFAPIISPCEICRRLHTHTHTSLLYIVVITLTVNPFARESLIQYL